MEPKKQVLLLIRKAIEGKLSLDELYSSWPDALDGDSFFEKVYDHIESAVEHYSGDLMKGKSKATKFLNSVEHQNLKNDLKLIDTKQES